jgi:glycosyltransferase involved in cell wall biosynthesis
MYNIALLTNVFFPVVNGVVHSIHLLSKGLKKLGFNVSVIHSQHPNSNTEKLSLDYNLLPLPSIYFPNFDYCIPNPFFLKREINNISKKFDILQINHPFLIFKLAKDLKKRDKNLKVIFVYHTQYDQYHHYAKFIPKFLYRFFLDNHLKEVFSFVDFVVFPSLSFMNSVKNKFHIFRDKFIFIPNPVDVDHMKNFDSYKVSELKNKYNLNGKFVLGFVGRLEKEKNLFFLLEIFKNVVDKLNNPDDIRLILVGGGTQYKELIDYSLKLNLDKYVIFTDKVDYNEIQNYYRLIDLFVSVSFTEVKPLSYLESLASGVPILAIRAFGADDLIIDNYNGFLVEQNYKENMVRKIVEFYQKRSVFQKLKVNSIASAEKYSYISISKQYVDLYKSLL